MTKRGLGRGLDALLSSRPSEGDTLAEIAVEAIRPNPNQPRKEFDPTALSELSNSIKTSGMIQPLVVRRFGGGYELIAGERRWRAARQAGLTRIPAIVRETTAAESLEIALLENLLREDLNPLEEAEAFQKLLAEFGWTQEQLSSRIGRDRSSVANSLRLLKLPDAIQDDLRSRRLTMGHARALLALTSQAEQLRLRDEILAQSWSVRTTEEGVQRRRARTAGHRRRTAEIAAVQESLQRALMARVRIRGTHQRGLIEITYATAEELERLVALLRGQA